MKGFFIQPEKPSEVVRKLKLENQVSTSKKTEEQILKEVTSLWINGNLQPKGVYSKFSIRVNSYPTLPYAFIEGVRDFTWEIFAELHYKFYHAKKVSRDN
jgi:hypothetical protein